MKISIDTQDCSYDTLVEIDGRKFRLSFKANPPTPWSFWEIDADGKETLLTGQESFLQSKGGIALTLLKERLVALIQGGAPEADCNTSDEPYGTWERFPTDAMNSVTLQLQQIARQQARDRRGF